MRFFPVSILCIILAVSCSTSLIETKSISVELINSTNAEVETTIVSEADSDYNLILLAGSSAIVEVDVPNNDPRVGILAQGIYVSSYTIKDAGALQTINHSITANRGVIQLTNNSSYNLSSMSVGIGIPFYDGTPSTSTMESKYSLLPGESSWIWLSSALPPGSFSCTISYTYYDIERSDWMTEYDTAICNDVFGYLNQTRTVSLTAGNLVR